MNGLRKICSVGGGGGDDEGIGSASLRARFALLATEEVGLRFRLRLDLFDVVEESVFSFVIWPTSALLAVGHSARGER